MSNVSLNLGCALLAFGPYLSIFFLIIYKKAQLVIVATSAAFFFLLASTFASLTWFVFHTIGLNGPFSSIIPGVFFQFVARCAFVSLYHKVENVIQLSLQKQRDDELKDEQSGSNRGTDEGVADANSRFTYNNNRHWTDVARLRLELNDSVSAIAASTGYGGMHAVLLYGTLLARQTGNVGVLYQSSCPGMPSLVVSACFAFLFSILDIFWMLFAFFGMRRRLMYHRGDYLPSDSRAIGGWLGNSRHGGNLALLLSLISHFMASVFTIADYFPYGCRASIPAVAGVLLVTMYIFWAGCGRIYMPPNQMISSRGGSVRQSPAVFTGHNLQTANDYHEC